jgi:cell division protein FtsB
MQLATQAGWAIGIVVPLLTLVIAALAFYPQFRKNIADAAKSHSDTLLVQLQAIGVVNDDLRAELVRLKAREDELESEVSRLALELATAQATIRTLTQQVARLTAQPSGGWG